MTESGQPAWTVHIFGSDDVLKAGEYGDAVRIANEINTTTGVEGIRNDIYAPPRVWAVPVQEGDYRYQLIFPGDDSCLEDDCPCCARMQTGGIKLASEAFESINSRMRAYVGGDPGGVLADVLSAGGIKLVVSDD